MPLVSKKEFENSYTSPDGSIFIDFDSIDNAENEEIDEDDDENEEND
jgi:hypothetical protein